MEEEKRDGSRGRRNQLGKDLEWYHRQHRQSLAISLSFKAWEVCLDGKFNLILCLCINFKGVYVP